jgi:hypothetical protein
MTLRCRLPPPPTTTKTGGIAASAGAATAGARRRPQDAFLWLFESQEFSFVRLAYPLARP